MYAIGEQCGTSVYRYRVCIERRRESGGEEKEEEEEEEKGIDFSAGLCEMKPGRAIAINNDKNNPIRRLFDLSAPIFRARSIRLITIFLDLGGELRRYHAVPSRAEPSRAELNPACEQSQSARDRIYRIVLVELYSR